MTIANTEMTTLLIVSLTTPLKHPGRGVRIPRPCLNGADEGLHVDNLVWRKPVDDSVRMIGTLEPLARPYCSSTSLGDFVLLLVGWRSALDDVVDAKLGV